MYQLLPKHDTHAHHRIRYEVARIAENKVWKAASAQDSGGGLECGQPVLQPALKTYHRLLANGETVRATSLKAVVLNKRWTGQRIADALDERDTVSYTHLTLPTIE